MSRGRVLLVDDSVVVRKMVSDLLLADPDIESVTTASNGRLALTKLADSNPNLMILDVEMPEMDGLATLKEVRQRAPTLPVLMFSGLTERAGALTLEALALGASDYVTKPVGVGSVIISIEQVQVELLSKAKALLKRQEKPPPAPAIRSAVLPNAPLRTRIPYGRVDILAIGASTGGPNALADIIGSFPANMPVPIVIAQHMPPLFTDLFAKRLDEQSQLRVREGVTGARIKPGEVWIAPGNYHMNVRREGVDMSLVVHQGPPENSCRPSVDVLFRSVADVTGANTLAVVLTGMGLDGLRGCERIRETGGQIVVQDKASSVVWSMPGCVATAGLADEVVPLEHMAVTLLRRITSGIR